MLDRHEDIATSIVLELIKVQAIPSLVSFKNKEEAESLAEIHATYIKKVFKEITNYLSEESDA